MKLLKSNYDNKETINFLKASFSIIESSECLFCFSDFIEVNVEAEFNNGIYKISLERKGLHDGIVIRNEAAKVKTFDNRTEAIKHILRALKIIK